MELSGLVVNPEMKAVYDEAIKQNKKIIIVSDMYLPADFIKKVLHKNLIYITFFPTNLSGKAGFTANTHYHVIHYE